MNIITNKDVFSDENQAAMPKKVERRRGRPPMNRGAGNNPSNPATSSVAGAASVIAPQSVQATPMPVQPVQKTVFYQASRPRTDQGNQGNSQQPQRPAGQGRPPFRRPMRPNNQPQTNPNGPIDPRTLIPRGVQPQAPGAVQPQFQPQAPSQDGARRTHPSGFTTAPRRRDRGQFPQDTAGAFMMPSRANSMQGTRITDSFEPDELHKNGVPGKNVKIIPLGGLEEIGKNMTVIEYGDDIIIVDMGFMFPDSEMFGVDYIIPDVSYLEDKKDRIRGVIITHGHLDHTGAIPYLIGKIGYPPLYGTMITMGLAKQRLAEFGLTDKVRTINIQPEKDVLQLGAFKVNTFKLTHSVPGAVGLEIETPNGRIVYCTDWKFDYSPSDGVPTDYRVLAATGARGVDVLFSDSTNADKPGHSVSEKVVEQSLTTSIESAGGRVIIAMFSSNLNRIQQTINVAAKNGRKVLIVGRSMQQNVEMAVELKAIVMPPNTLITEREVNRFPDEKILVISTGAQGEDRSALTRMANGEHRVIRIKKGDTVIISASPIPGNERSVSGVMDVLYKAGASVIYNKTLDIHTTGHATQEDLKLMIALMRPKYFVPLHGERSKLIAHGKLAEEVGVSPENIIIGDNGLILEMDHTGKVYPTNNHVPAGYVMVDGLGVGDVGNIVLRDRQLMAQEGIFMIFSVFDKKTKKFLNSPDLISRGFIYMRENEGFINDIRTEVKRFLTKAAEDKAMDMSLVRNELRDHISKLLYEKTERQPMVIPVIAEV